MRAGPALVLPLICLGAGLGAAVIAWRAGGGADARVDPPRPQTEATPDLPPPQGAQAYEVKTRLVDALGTAHVDVQNLAQAQAALQQSWRRMVGPWARPPGLAGQLVMTLALRTSAGEETQWAIGTQDGGTWSPDARVWNMNEGSYDQREAIFAPGPSTMAFHLTVPLHARLRLATGLALPSSAPTRFDVEVVDAGGMLHTLSETHVEAGDSHGLGGAWRDLDLDLEPWGGQPVDLVLQTASEGTPTGKAAAPLAFWGDPVVVASGPTHLPYDVLWFVVDALRPDVAAGLHDAAEDAEKLASSRPPLETVLPAVPGLMPSIDALAARGVHFQHAWSAAAWTRPGTLAMLTGERSTEAGLDTTVWVMPPSEPARYYASSPPLLPLILRRSGAVTAAFVNNFFMSGYSAVGVDMGFERLTDHLYRTRDTAEIERDALSWLDAHRDDRFFLFVNFNSPHEPYDPPPEMLARVPATGAGGGPLDPQVRAYMGEGAKDDAAIGAILEKVEALGRTRTTLVVVTADHGETLSSAHQALGMGNMPMRFHHAVGNFEETTRIPIVMALPGVLEGGLSVKDRVRNIDIAPTVLDVEGLEAEPRMSGRSMLPLARGHKEADPRVVISEGRGSRALLWGPWRLIVHDGGEKAGTAAHAAPHPADRDAGDEPPVEDELYDLAADPGERHNVARQHPYVVTDLKARMVAGLANVPTADATIEPRGLPSRLSARFAGGGQVHRVTGTLTAGDGRHMVTVGVDPVGVARESLRIASSDGDAGTGIPRALIDFAFVTAPEALVGFDLRVDPPGAPVTWQLFLDDAPWPEGRVFAGPFGLPAVAARAGVTSDEAREELYAVAPAPADPARDLGVFLTRGDLPRPRSGDESADEGSSEGVPGESAATPGEGGNAAAAKEMQRMLEQWGYAHRAAPAAPAAAAAAAGTRAGTSAGKN